METKSKIGYRYPKLRGLSKDYPNEISQKLAALCRVTGWALGQCFGKSAFVAEVAILGHSQKLWSELWGQKYQNKIFSTGSNSSVAVFEYVRTEKYNRC